MAEEDDPVVQEVDVFLTKTPQSQLYLFQFPVRPNTETYDDMNVLHARMKPNQQKVELEFSMNVNTSTYDESKGEQFALNVDGKTKEGDCYFNSKLMDKQVLSSAKLPGKSSRYAVGWINKGNIYLQPLSGALVLRPSFDHLDRSDSKQRQENKEESGEADQEEEAVREVTVKFARPDNDKQKKAREKSFRYIQKSMSEEPWIEFVYRPFQANTSDIERRRLLFCQKDPVASRLHVPSKDYLEAFFTDFVDTTRFESLPLQKGSSQVSPTADKVKSLLMNAKVLEFDHLLALLGNEIDTGAVLHLVQQSAVLVQGCWVVKSDLLYSKETRNMHTAVPVNVMVTGRDYVLWSFTKSRTVSRKEMAKATKLPAEELLQILEQISTRISTKWEFKLPTDEKFQKSFSEVLQRQVLVWDKIHQHLVKQLKLENSCIENISTRLSV